MVSVAPLVNHNQFDKKEGWYFQHFATKEAKLPCLVSGKKIQETTKVIFEKGILFSSSSSLLHTHIFSCNKVAHAEWKWALETWQVALSVVVVSFCAKILLGSDGPKWSDLWLSFKGVYRIVSRCIFARTETVKGSWPFLSRGKWGFVSRQWKLYESFARTTTLIRIENVAPHETLVHRKLRCKAKEGQITFNATTDVLAKKSFC